MKNILNAAKIFAWISFGLASLVSILGSIYGYVTMRKWFDKE